MTTPCLIGAGCVSPQITADLAYFPPPPAVPHVVHLKSFNRLSDLVPPRTTWAGLFGGPLTSPSIGKAAGIAYVDGHLYVCDTDANIVHDWDLARGTGRQVGAEGDVVLTKPVAVAVDGDGTMYVADTERSEVIAFDAAGQSRLRLKPADRKAYRPTAVAVQGSTLYAADIAAHKIDRFSTETGRHLGAFGKVGSATGEFYYPMGLALDRSGRLFLSDTMNARVQLFDRDGRFVLGMGRPGDRYGDMGKPRHLAVGPDGVVFVADPEFAHVHLFDASGRLLMLLGGPQEAPGGTPMPVGVAVAESLPESISGLVPADFRADYFLFVANTVGRQRIGLFAIGSPQAGEHHVSTRTIPDGELLFDR